VQEQCKNRLTLSYKGTHLVGSNSNRRLSRSSATSPAAPNLQSMSHRECLSWAVQVVVKYIDGLQQTTVPPAKFLTNNSGALGLMCRNSSSRKYKNTQAKAQTPQTHRHIKPHTNSPKHQWRLGLNVPQQLK